MSNLRWTMIAILLLASVLLRNNLLFLLTLFLLLMGGTSLLWTHVCLNSVSYQRHLGRHRLFRGEETDLSIEIVNAKPLPLAWLRAVDDFPSALELQETKLARSHLAGRARLVNLMSLRWYERVTRRYRLRAMQRGAWYFGPVELTSGDIFGFGVRRQLINESGNVPGNESQNGYYNGSFKGTDMVLVYPKIVPLTALGLPALRPFGDLHTMRRLIDDPLRMMGTRDYTSGDSFRHIHWKATARRQALQTKVFEPSAMLPLSIFLNVNTDEKGYTRNDLELQEFAITTAASIARWAWEGGHAVGLFVNAITQPSAQRIRISPRSSPDQLLYILEALAKVVNYGQWSIEALVQSEAQYLPYGASVVVVTAIADRPLHHSLMELRKREFGTSLVTLGEEPEALHLPGIRHYHIGGRKEWDDLASLELA